MEADFQREYGLDLGQCVQGMSWRRFKVLLAGLSGDSPTVVVACNAPVEYEDDEEAVQRVKEIWR